MWEDDPGTKITDDEWQHMISLVHETVCSNRNDYFKCNCTILQQWPLFEKTSFVPITA